MRKKLAITCLLFAWVCANGALLDVVQVFAWGKMFSGYAKTMSVAAALKETFDPAKPCEMCLGVTRPPANHFISTARTAGFGLIKPPRMPATAQAASLFGSVRITRTARASP